MNSVDIIRFYCLSKPNTDESFPFDNDSLVLKVSGKIFAIISLEPPFYINLKCDPEKAIELREIHPFIVPGYHMNKKHWNTIYLDSAPIQLVQDLIDHSYNLISKSIKPKKS
jgi:predicted DNA-binding protein (MmcQ/YjbR family)